MTTDIESLKAITTESIDLVCNFVFCLWMIASDSSLKLWGKLWSNAYFSCTDRCLAGKCSRWRGFSTSQMHERGFDRQWSPGATYLVWLQQTWGEKGWTIYDFSIFLLTALFFFLSLTFDLVVQESKILKFLGFMWNPLSWVMEAAALMAIGLAHGGVRL